MKKTNKVANVVNATTKTVVGLVATTVFIPWRIAMVVPDTIEAAYTIVKEGVEQVKKGEAK